MAIVVLSFASTTIHWLWLLAFLSLFMLKSCLADDQLKLHRLSSRKLCPSCNTRLELYPFFGDSLAAQESISDQTGHTVWIPIRVSVSAAAVMMLLGSFLWHMSRGNALFEENDQEADIRGSRESRTGNDCTDNTSEGENQVECPDSSLCRLDITCTMTIQMILPKVKTRCNIQTSRCVSGENKMDNQVDTQDVPSFSLNVIRKATEYFSGKNMIGRGGFGNVYKGVLPDGQEIAVKRLSTSSRQGVEQLNNEVVLLAKLQHRNLVRLLGFCLDGEEKILIYEFVTNKSLSYFLDNPERQRILDWSRRYKIIEGIAQGILYFHENSAFRVIHRDLKASNILLDDNMNPKISDFDMGTILRKDQTEDNTYTIVGTLGYMSPEYVMHGQLSVKSDVYSFGVLILEIITSKKNSSFYKTDGAENLLSNAWKHWRDGTPMELLDSNLTDSYSRNEVMRCIHLGLLCVQEDPAARPTMATIVLMLNSYSVTLPLPQQPAYCEHITKGTDSDKSMLCSVDDASITVVHPR